MIHAHFCTTGAFSLCAITPEKNKHLCIKYVFCINSHDENNVDELIFNLLLLKVILLFNYSDIRCSFNRSSVVYFERTMVIFFSAREISQSCSNQIKYIKNRHLYQYNLLLLLFFIINPCAVTKFSFVLQRKLK